MHFKIAALSALTLLGEKVLAQGSDEWGIWFFADGCKSTNGYNGIPGDRDTTLTCMSSETLDSNGKTVPGPYTNIVTSNLKELGMKVTLWNDTSCRELITTIDTDGCQVVPENNHIAAFNIGPA